MLFVLPLSSLTRAELTVGIIGSRMPGGRIVDRPKGIDVPDGIEADAPQSQAVPSPSGCATKPCAASRKVMATIAGITRIVTR